MLVKKTIPHQNVGFVTIFAGGVGLGDQIIAYLVGQRYTQGQGQGVPTSPARDASKSEAHTGGVSDGNQ